jgi:integrase
MLLMMMYRHGLRVTEAIRLRREDADLVHSRLWVERLKGSLSVEHPLAGDELRTIKRYLTARKESFHGLFVSERGQPLTRQAVNYLIRSRRTRWAGECASAYPQALMRLLSRRQGYRPANDARLFGPSRPTAHRPLHAGVRPAI